MRQVQHHLTPQQLVFTLMFNLTISYFPIKHCIAIFLHVQFFLFGNILLYVIMSHSLNEHVNNTLSEFGEIILMHMHDVELRDVLDYSIMQEC